MEQRRECPKVQMHPYLQGAFPFGGGLRIRLVVVAISQSRLVFYAAQHARLGNRGYLCPLFGILGLGSADSSTQPDESVDETQKAKISFGQLLKSGQDTTIVLDFADEALD